ncbi:hypothetical protein HF086_008587 [Spodoptera exigua]|uniref:Peptidase A2 domain-containing protein n=2 Tax=Spodoptera exigua TaxID=7107 RepID=A0A922M365_SPOEX|nr:hypothetical protein HF086_008587 [Spodoptera exigua]
MQSSKHQSSSSSSTSGPSAKTPNKQPNANHVAVDDEELLLTTLSINVRCSDGTYITLRALLDQGSQISLISENAVQRLGLQRRRYNASVSGIGSGASQSKGLVSIDCQSIYGDYNFTTEALVISRVASNLPSVQFKKQSWPHLQHLQLADPEYNVSKPIDLLLDVSIYSQIIMDGLIKGPSQAPIAQQTALGWILSGNVRTFNCHIVTNNISDLSKYWEIEDVEPSSSSSLTSEEQYCEEFYQQTTRRLDTGRYEVGIPMKPEYENQLGSSKSKAIAQFKQLERKMCNNLLFSESYKSFMSEYQQLGHMCKADNVDESKPAFYLPHHGVIKLDSTTTKLRVVFNASSKSSSASTLRQSFYMDDLLGGTNTINQARELQHQLIEMLKGAGMNLRKWSSNDPELLKDLSSDQLNSPFDFKCSESKKTLGLRWNPSTDTFSFQNPVQCRNQCVTKRQLLSEISKLFDPLGWLSPLSIRAKLLFQNAWSLKLSWDENVPQSIQDDWIHLRSDLNLIDQFIIPRYIGNTNQLYQIHAFCDASDKAYACAVYVVSKDHKGECISRLAVAKTKLAPLAKRCHCQGSNSVVRYFLLNLSRSSLTRIVKIVAWISRFIKRSRGKHTGGTEFLTSAELHNALHLIIQNYQLYEFHEDIQFINQKGYVHPKSKISCLNPFLDEDILIKEENLPPGKWALGRIQDVHPGKDNYVRVVSLKTKGDNIIKRPVNKLVLLPTNEDTAQDQAIDQGNSSNPSPPSSCQQKKSERTQRSRRGISFKSLFIHSLLFIFMLLSPVHAQSTNNHQSYNLTSLDENQAIYFDRLSNLQNIKDLYRLLKVSARVISNYLIIEIKIPLLSNEMFELNKIISISQKQGQHYYQFLTSVSFIAYNLHKDTAFLLSEEDLKSCTHIPSDILLCSLNMPIYDLKMKQSICDIKIINHAHLCKSVKSSCEERWIKLHRPNTWLYTCCPECQVRIICANGVTMTHLINNGIITLGQGCTLKGDTFSIYAHNNFFSNLNIHHHIEVPEVSMLNRIMKTSIPDNISMVEDHQVIWDQLRAQIDEVKEQSSTDLSIHDVHHYTVLYISVAAVIILGGVVVYLIRSRRAAAGAAASPAPRARRLLGRGRRQSRRWIRRQWRHIKRDQCLSAVKCSRSVV